MSWRGLRHKGVEPLFVEEWNALVDALNDLYGWYFGLAKDCPPVANKLIGKLLSLTTTPVPLSDVYYNTRRIHIWNPDTSAAFLYICPDEGDEYPVPPGKEIVLHHGDPTKVKVRGEKDMNVYVLFEVLE